MKNLFLAAIAAMFVLSSCNNVFYQVYDAKAPGMAKQGNSLVYENEDCKLMYNLWSEDGKIDFILQNKTDKDLFLVLSQTFFIKNGIAFDYFKNREHHTTETRMLSSYASVGSTVNGVDWSGQYSLAKQVGVGMQKNKGYSFTAVEKERPIICVPAMASKHIKGYSISDELIRTCDKKQDRPSKKSLPISYTVENTPLSFKNRIAYSFDKDGAGLKHIENSFWVSEVINYSKSEALQKEEFVECKGDVAEIIYVFKMAAPNKFYNTISSPKLIQP